MKTTSQMVDEYLAKYPPESFWANEVAGAVRPKLTPRQSAHDYRPPAAPRRRVPDQGAMMTEITRQDLDLAYAEVASIIGAPESTVRAAALELSVGMDADGNTTFASLTDEATAVAELVKAAGHTAEEMVGLTGPDSDDMLVMSVADQVAGIISRAPWREFHDRQGQLRTQPMADFGKASQALLPTRPELPAEPAQLSADGRAEVERYLALSQSRKPVYGAVRRDGERPDSMALTNHRINGYLELAENGATRTYDSNGGTVYEYDTTDEGGDTPDEAKIVYFLNQWAEKMGQSPLSRDTGNRAGSQPGPATFGQRDRTLAR